MNKTIECTTCKCKFTGHINKEDTCPNCLKKLIKGERNVFKEP